MGVTACSAGWGVSLLYASFFKEHAMESCKPVAYFKEVRLGRAKCVAEIRNHVRDPAI